MSQPIPLDLEIDPYADDSEPSLAPDRPSLLPIAFVGATLLVTGLALLAASYCG